MVNSLQLKKQIFFLLLIILVNQIFAVQVKTKNILFISSYSYDWSSVPYQLKGFSEEINSLDNVDYLFMDTKNVPYSEAEQTILSLINNNQKKYASYDCIVASDDNALKFASAYKNLYLGDAPLVFLAVNDVEKAQKVALAPDVSGIIEKGYYRETIDFALDLFPNAENIVAITDNSISATGSKQQFEIALSDSKLSRSYINTSLLTSAQIADTINSLSSNTILVLLNFKEDSESNQFSVQQAAHFINKNASIPCFRTDYPSIKYGLLGGRVLKFDYMGQQAAKLVNRYLSDEDMSSVGSFYTPGTVCINDDVVKKFNLHIPSSYLKDAEILNKRSTFAQKYFLQIIIIFSGLFVFSIILFHLKLLKYIAIRKKQSNVITLANNNLHIAYEQLKSAEAEARNANLVKTDFLARMSHDMRTPLGAIIGLSAFGMNENNDTTNYDYFRKIKNSANYLLGLVNDILDMQKIETDTIVLHPEIYSLSSILENIETIVRPLAEEKRIVMNFSTTIQQATDYAILDEKRFSQIFINLLNNSVKYTPEDGTISFSLTTEKKDSNVFINVVISDNGVGMSKVFQTHMFESFTKEKNMFTNSESGSGLGLSITKNIVTLMGGSIYCKSKLNLGTTFTVVLPIETPSTQEIIKAKNSKLTDKVFKSFKDKHILLCEDNAINTEIVKKLLESKGFSIDCAINGKIGIDKFSQNSALKTVNDKYDAILMDIRMPIMNGLEATQKIRAIDKKIPIIALSANAYQEDIDKSLSVGMNAHLMKPIDPDILFKTLAQFIK